MLTTHRRENFGSPLEEICIGIRELIRRNPELIMVYQVHLNPSVQETVHRILSEESRIYLIDPVPYLSFLHLMNQADLILTDSGGIQEEAPTLGKPVLVLRQYTERPEGVQAGVAKVIGYNADRIISESEHLLKNADAYSQMATAINPYGDGQAAKRIVQILIDNYQ